MRITAQLIDAATGNHPADRYDGDLTDVFACRTKSRRKSSPRLSPGWTEGTAHKPLAGYRRVGHGTPREFAGLAIDQGRKETQSKHSGGLSSATRLCAGTKHVGLRSIDFRLSWVGLMDPCNRQPLAAWAAELDDSDPWAHLALGFGERSGGKPLRQRRKPARTRPQSELRSRARLSRFCSQSTAKPSRRAPI